MNTTEIGDISSESKVKTILLDHFYPQFKKEDLVDEIRSGFEGEIVIAKDLDVLEV